MNELSATDGVCDLIASKEGEIEILRAQIARLEGSLGGAGHASPMLGGGETASTTEPVSATESRRLSKDGSKPKRNLW